MLLREKLGTSLPSGRPSPVVAHLEMSYDGQAQMIGKRKSSGNVRRAGRLEADLGQKEAELEKTQAELETASEAQLSHMAGGKAAKAALRQKAKIESK